MERIRMIGLGKSFGVRQVFSNVSFEIKEGDRLALVGPNGAGKSTLLKCILGYEELDEGNVVKSPVASIGYLLGLMYMHWKNNLKNLRAA